MTEWNYAAATITFLDRDSGEKKAMTYPITEIELQNVYPDRAPKVAYRFKVNEKGEWIEMEIPT